jgi:hypothetical protein
MAIGATRGKKRLARYLKPLIEQSGLQVDDLVRQVRCSRPTIFRLLSGDSLPGWPVVLAVLGLVGATDEQRTQALKLWEIADVPTSAVSFAKALPVAYRRFRLDEMEADIERTLDTAVIPGMLQTRSYTEALALRNRFKDNPEEWNKAAPAERHERQALLSREDRPLRLISLIDESALRRVVGSPAVMVEQLDRLVAAGEGGAVSIRVIPFSAGPYPASAGSMTLFSYDGEDRPEVGFTEQLSGLKPVDDAADVDKMIAMWEQALSLAVDESGSAALIAAVRGELSGVAQEQ